MAIISVTVWCTDISKSGSTWTVDSNSVQVTLDIDDVNNDGSISNAEWDAFTGGTGSGNDTGAASLLYDGASGNAGTLYSDTQYTAGTDVTAVFNTLSNTFSADPDLLGQVVCFVKGTRILTDTVEVCVEHLAVGDLVETLQSGLQKIRWIGQRKLSGTELEEHLQPIRIAKGAMGIGLPTRDLYVSPQHRVLISGAYPELMFAEPDVLIPAKNLINDRNIWVDRNRTEVTYFHIMFDKHEVVFSEGAPTESFHAGAYVVNSMESATRQELLSIFPELENEVANMPSAHRSLKRYEAVAMAGFLDSQYQNQYESSSTA